MRLEFSDLLDKLRAELICAQDMRSHIGGLSMYRVLVALIVVVSSLLVDSTSAQDVRPKAVILSNSIGAEGEALPVMRDEAASQGETFEWLVLKAGNLLPEGEAKEQGSSIVILTAEPVEYTFILIARSVGQQSHKDLKRIVVKPKSTTNETTARAIGSANGSAATRSAAPTATNGEVKAEIKPFTGKLEVGKPFRVEATVDSSPIVSWTVKYGEHAADTPIPPDQLTAETRSLKERSVEVQSAKVGQYSFTFTSQVGDQPAVAVLLPLTVAKNGGGTQPPSPEEEKVALTLDDRVKAKLEESRAQWGDRLFPDTAKHLLDAIREAKANNKYTFEEVKRIWETKLPTDRPITEGAKLKWLAFLDKAKALEPTDPAKVLDAMDKLFGDVPNLENEVAQRVAEYLAKKGFRPVAEGSGSGSTGRTRRGWFHHRGN